MLGVCYAESVLCWECVMLRVCYAECVMLRVWLCWECVAPMLGFDR